MTIKVYPELPLLQKDLIDEGLGYYPEKRSFDVLGHAYNIINNRVDVTNIGGTSPAVYVFPASPIQMRIVSSSANDTSGGTGIRSVTLHYLDTNYAVQQEDITLNGTTPVNTVATNILRVQEVHAKTVGSIGQSAGDIILTDTTGTTVYARIETGFNRNRNATFTIPAGKTGYLTHWNISSGTSSGTHYTRFTLRMTTHDGVVLPGVFIGHDGSAALNASENIYYDIPITLPERTDIKVSVISDAANANAEVNSHFSGWYE